MQRSVIEVTGCWASAAKSLGRSGLRTGKLAFTGAYRYEPGTAHPHRVRLRLSSADAADLEAELKPSLRRNASLLARALGRSGVPDWLRDRRLEGSIRIGDLQLAKLKDLLWHSGKLDAEATVEAAGLGPQLLSSLRLTDLSLRTEDEIFTGSGSLEEDGRLLLLLTNGTREMRMSGTLATLKWEEPGAGARLTP